MYTYTNVIVPLMYLYIAIYIIANQQIKSYIHLMKYMYNNTRKVIGEIEFHLGKNTIKKRCFKYANLHVTAVRICAVNEFREKNTEWN